MPANQQDNSEDMQLVLFDKVATIRDIESREPDSKEIWYGHSILTSTLFPATQPKAGTDYIQKSNGNIDYFLEPGIDPKTRLKRYPYGKYPRLLMAWMAKQIRTAGNHKTDTVDPETKTITIPTFYRLCEEMGLPRGGMTNEVLREQLRLLLACHISVQRTTGFAGRDVQDVVYLPIVKASRDVHDRTESGLSGAMFVITDEVWERLKNESAPFDTRISGWLLSGRSVLPYDVYVWLTGSMHRLNHDLPVSWDWLYERFGEGSSEKNFKQKFRQALTKIREVYPALNVEVPNRGDGIILHPSPTSVPARGRRRGQIEAGDVD